MKTFRVYTVYTFYTMDAIMMPQDFFVEFDENGSF